MTTHDSVAPLAADARVPHGADPVDLPADWLSLADAVRPDPAPTGAAFLRLGMDRMLVYAAKGHIRDLLATVALLRTALDDLVHGLDWWRVDEADREFPAEHLRDARAALAAAPDAAPPAMTHEDRLRAAGAVDLRDNARVVPHGDGYVSIEPIDPAKVWGPDSPPLVYEPDAAPPNPQSVAELADRLEGMGIPPHLWPAFPHEHIATPPDAGRDTGAAVGYCSLGHTYPCDCAGARWPAGSLTVSLPMRPFEPKHAPGCVDNDCDRSCLAAPHTPAAPTDAD